MMLKVDATKLLKLFPRYVQSTHIGYGKVDESSVYTCTGSPLPQDIQVMVDWMLNESFSTAFESKVLYWNYFRVVVYCYDAFFFFNSRDFVFVFFNIFLFVLNSLREFFD